MWHYELLTLKKSSYGLLLVSVQHHVFFVSFLCWLCRRILFMIVRDILLICCLFGAFKRDLQKKLIVFVSKCQSEGTAENLKRHWTHVCQPELPEPPSMNMPNLILNQQRGNFGCVSQPESTNSAEAQCQCVIHLNTVKLKAVYCSQRPFILLNVSLLLANLSVRASTCQDEEGKSWGYQRRVFIACLISQPVVN